MKKTFSFQKNAFHFTFKKAYAVTTINFNCLQNNQNLFEVQRINNIMSCGQHKVWLTILKRCWKLSGWVLPVSVENDVQMRALTIYIQVSSTNSSWGRLIFYMSVQCPFLPVEIRTDPQISALITMWNYVNISLTTLPWCILLRISYETGLRSWCKNLIISQRKWF